MITDNANAAGLGDGFMTFACASCGGPALASCRCGRVRGDWLLAEEVVVIPAPRATDHRAGPAPGQARS